MVSISAKLPLRGSSQPPVVVSPSSSRVPELDGLRGIAIGMVVLYHAFFFHFAPRSGSALGYLLFPVRIGCSGVDFVFLFSGVLFAVILVAAKTYSHSFRPFYIR